MPCFSHLRMSGPYGLVNLKPAIAAPTAFFSSRVQRFDAGEVLGAVGGVHLGEVDDVDGRLLLGDELLEGLGQGDLRVRVLERDRALDRLHRGGGPAVEAGERLLEEA